MNFDQKLRAYAEGQWEERRKELEGTAILAELDAVLEECEETERLYLTYVFATLPVSDLGDYEPKLFLSCVQGALRRRREFSWCAELPEHLFLLWVLYPRINNEELSDCRGLFYSELSKRVSGLSLTDAVLEVNRWCAEHVTYRSTDDRTASALAVYRCGYGRCGEESTFAVNALRSVGIAARQVYAPWWSHCDDNHAWVEVWDGEAWRYLGACEPEPLLDRGWFTGAASRAVMIHARAFVRGGREDFAFLFPDTEAVDLMAEHGVALEAVTRRYAETELVTATVLNGRGEPVPGARVACSVLNMAAFREVCAAGTDESGTARFRLGRGSVLFSVSFGAEYAETLLDVSKGTTAVLTLSRPRGNSAWTLEFRPPQAAPVLPVPLPPALREARRSWLEIAASKRRERHIGTGQRLTPRQELILRALTKKDRAVPVSKEVLEDAELAFQYEKTVPAQVFRKELLPQRISLEPLRPWRAALAVVENAGETREEIWQWVETHIALDDGAPAIVPTPVGALRLRRATRHGKMLLFHAMCRAKGIPTKPEIVEPATLLLERGGPTRPVSNENCSCSKWEPCFHRFVPADVRVGENVLPAGRYRFLSTTRLPNGSQLAAVEDFTLTKGERKTIAPVFRQGEPAEMLEHRPLPAFTLRTLDGRRQESGPLLAACAQSLLVWLEVGREPTEHILNELSETKPPCALHFILETPEQESDPTLQKALARLPEARLWLGDFQEDAAALARQMFGDPDRLPLVLLSDCEGNGLYSCSGYNVGTAKLLLSLLEALRS